MTRRHHTGAATLAPLLFLSALAGAAPAAAQQRAPATPAARAAAFDLSVASIMRGEALVGRSPSDLRWSEDGRWLWFRWRRPEARDTATHLYRVPAGGGEPQEVADSVAWRTVPALNGTWARDRSRRVVERGGDIYVVARDGSERRITATPARESSPHLSPDGRTVYFVQGSNVFAVDLAGGTLRQLTDIRLADAPRREEPKGQRGYLEQQETELFDVIRGRRAQRERREALDSARALVRPTYLGKSASLSSAEVSPSGRYVLIEVDDDSAAQKPTMVANFVTESGYVEPINARAKVGDVQDGGRVGVLDVATGRVAWVEPEAKERQLSLSAAGWSPTGDRALVVGIPADFKDRWLYVAGPDGRTVTVDHLRDTAWVGGPAFAVAGWMPDGQRIWFVSERTGYSHLYTVAATGGEARALTSGSWEVTDVQLSPDGRTFYLTTSETHPGERGLYAVPAAGGARTRIDRLDGWNEATVSPDGRTVAFLHSTASTPPELYLMPLRTGAAARQVTESRTAEFRSGPWINPEVVVFPARDGGRVHARIYRPRDLGAQPNGAAVLFVHGAGYLQNAHKGWSTYFREYMFNHLLASRGYTVMDVDYRGSAGYGAAWRTGIYKHMGGKDLTDHVDAVRWMVANEGVDPKRVGLYGGSYGGFITLMGLFTEPDVFRSGAALRSVTDWAHYNHGYTSRILGRPQDDPAAYRRSSPIYFAEGLRGDLLIAHGMVDTNVEFQDVVRLSQRLIELGKPGWEMAVYPVEDHGFVRADSWTDEYRRILELFERTLREPAR
jgi:dipeptidyl aminopeptidase/acylaminoacyl peptidase